MNVAELPISGIVKERILEKGITKLNEPQRLAVENGLMDRKNIVVSSPTASGKTLMATLASLKIFENDPKAKVLYLVPLKALASEKYAEYTKLFKNTPVEVAASTGDLDSPSSWLASKNLIILTVEKLDSLLRHNPFWIHEVKLLVVDEIHLLNDASRGPTLEVVLTRMQALPQMQLLGLSATIKNAQELSDWLKCTLVESSYRPVELHEGVAWNGQIEFYVHKERSKKSNTQSPFMTAKEKEQRGEQKNAARIESIRSSHEAPLNIVEDTAKSGKQAIVFVNSRRSAEAQAEKCGSVLASPSSETLERLSEQILHALETPTRQCKRLAACVKTGAAFHHAGLVQKQRELVEAAFRDGTLSVICATPTLAIGLSLPAYRIIVRDLQRFTGSGMNYIPTLEYKQMAGRAGRPEHHEKGEAICIAKNPGEKETIIDRYVLGDCEEIYSKISVEPVLRMHALSLIASGITPSFSELMAFFARTFYAHQYGEVQKIEGKLKGIVEDFIAFGFLDVENDRLDATKIGKRVAELYIDPLTAHHILLGMEKAEQSGTKLMSYIHLLCDTVEMRPLLRTKNADRADVEELAEQFEPFFLQEIPSAFDHEYEEFIDAVKTAAFFMDWINERTEDDILERFGVTPGEIRMRLANIDWLLYAAEELCGLKGWKKARKEVKNLRTRVKYGVKEELIKLVKLKGIGKVRSRKLFNAGVKSAADIAHVEFSTLRKIIGEATAKKLREQVGGSLFDKENVLSYFEEAN